MEKTVTLRFYDVQRTAEDRPLLADILTQISAEAVADRGRYISDDIFVRLEDFNNHQDCIEGQFVRGQSANRPGRMRDGGTENLPFEEPIGHGIAFRYRPADGLLAIEFNPLVLSPSRVMEYIYAWNARAEYALMPRMREDVWEQFDQRPLRKVTLQVAGHPNVAGADDPNNATWANIGDIRDRYEAHSIKIEIGMGHRGGSLTASAKNLIRDAFARHTDGTDDIRTLKATLDNGEGQPNDEVNLIAELLDVREDLSFPGDDWAKFYELRRNLLRTKLDAL
jgi:hypothetical protein